MDSLWMQYAHQEEDEDEGAGLLYCLRYDYDSLHQHREYLVSALMQAGISLKEEQGAIGIRRSKDTNLLPASLLHLLEELSCVNEACFYAEDGIASINSIPELCEILTVGYGYHIASKEFALAYQLVAQVIPSFTRNFYRAHEQNAALSSSDCLALDDLVSFAQTERESFDQKDKIVPIRPF